MQSSQRSERFLVFGEVLFDCFPDGSRIIGGAPFNVAWALSGMGEMPTFISAVGQDADGESVIRMMQNRGICSDGVGLSKRYSTGTVDIFLDGADASYRIPEFSAWDDISKQPTTRPKYVYHGLLALRHEGNRRVLKAILEGASAQRFFDLNLRPPFTAMDVLDEWLMGVDWLKLNLDELRVVAQKECEALAGAIPTLDKLRARYQIANVLLTAGAEGAMAYGDCGKYTISPAPKPTALVDTVGAGDAFSAVMLHKLGMGSAIEACMQAAVEMASKVCSIQGALDASNDFYKL